MANKSGDAAANAYSDNAASMSTSAIDASHTREAICVNDVECSLCLRILYNPVTTTCGHSYCKTCLYEAIRTAPKCPICRCPMPPYSSPDVSADICFLARMVVFET